MSARRRDAVLAALRSGGGRAMTTTELKALVPDLLAGDISSALGGLYAQRLVERERAAPTLGASGRQWQWRATPQA